MTESETVRVRMKAAALAGIFCLLTAVPAVSQVNDGTLSASSVPIVVKTAIQLDQISEVNQKEENFTIVGNLIMTWTDPAYAFEREECGCDDKLFNEEQFDEYIGRSGLKWPRFLFYNQQGNRWVQDKFVRVLHDGRALYYERFTVTLQAPDFDFLKYPFDTQRFAVRIMSLHRDSVYRLVADTETSRTGGQLGEEEWQVDVHSTSVESVDFGELGVRTQYTFSFLARRHVSYYLSRIFLPLFLIILVAYATFFMRDYAKRVDYSAANLLTFVMFNFAIGSDLPRLGYLTFVDSIVVLGFVVTAVTVIANVIQKRLSVSEKEEIARRWDGVILWGYPALYVAGIGASVAVFLF